MPAEGKTLGCHVAIMYTNTFLAMLVVTTVIHTMSPKITINLSEGLESELFIQSKAERSIML